MGLLVARWSLSFLAITSGCCGIIKSEYVRSDQAGGWLSYHATPATWEEARLKCHAEGAILASPLNEKLKIAIETFLSRQSVEQAPERLEHGVTVFIGVHATFSKGDYSSIEGVPLLRLAIFWAPGEPNNLDNLERCLVMTMDSDNYGIMADTRCDRQLPYVCYKKDKGKKFRFDYEWSEQADGWLKYHVVPALWKDAVPRCHAEGAVLASPLNKQLEAAIVSLVQSQKTFNKAGLSIFTGFQKNSINNFISIEGVPIHEASINWTAGECNCISKNCLAMTISYNSTVGQTHCDRVLPYVCYKKNINMTISKCGTVDPEYDLEPRTGSCYKLYNLGKTWAEAYMTCAADGGCLAVLNDAEEAQVVKEIYSNYPASTITGYWEGSLSVGFHDWGHFGESFMTIHGESLDKNYHKWGKNQPDNTTHYFQYGDRGEFCGSVGRDGSLNDHICNGPSPFLCEKNPHSLLNNYEV